MADNASDTGQRKGIVQTVIDNKIQIGFSVMVMVVGLAFWAGGFVKTGQLEKGQTELQIEACRTELQSGNKALTEKMEAQKLYNEAHLDNCRTEVKTGNDALKMQIENLAKTMDTRAQYRDKEIDAINKRLDKHDIVMQELMERLPKKGL